jgi:hypothetical protein
MIGRNDWLTIAGSADSQNEQWRAHKRRIAAVLALYACLVSIGLIAAVTHRADVSPSGRPAVEASADKAAH